jgi:hypothetical protein
MLSDECLGVMKFTAGQSLVTLAMFGSTGGDEFYAAMREGITDPDELARTEKVVDAIKSITEAMGGDGFGEAVAAELLK